MEQEVLMASTLFDAAAEVATLRTQTQVIRKRHYRQRLSQLDAYHGEILQLHDAGASMAEIQRWLAKKRIRVAHSTVSRWLHKRLAHG